MDKWVDSVDGNSSTLDPIPGRLQCLATHPHAFSAVIFFMSRKSQWCSSQIGNTSRPNAFSKLAPARPIGPESRATVNCGHCLGSCASGNTRRCLCLGIVKICPIAGTSVVHNSLFLRAYRPTTRSLQLPRGRQLRQAMTHFHFLWVHMAC